MHACLQEVQEAASKPAEPDADAFEAAFFELQKWVDTAEEKYALLHAKRLARKGRLAAAVKCALSRGRPGNRV